MLLLGLPLVFRAVPVACTVLMSVHAVDMFSLLSFHRPFVGLHDYVALSSRDTARRVFASRALFTLVSVSAQLVAGFALALFFQRRFRSAATIRGAFPAGWLSDPGLALYAVIIANVWLGVPFNMILLSVGLAAIPKDLHEAARMDGGTRRDGAGRLRGTTASEFACSSIRRRRFIFGILR